MLSTNDFPLALVALLDNPPWERMRERALEVRGEGEREGE